MIEILRGRDDLWLPQDFKVNEMLTLLDAHPRYQRREMLRIGASGLAGLGAANWLTSRAIAGSKTISNKSVILLFLHGGPSQIETFDPKMTAPVGIQSATGAIQ